MPAKQSKLWSTNNRCERVWWTLWRWQVSKKKSDLCLLASRWAQLLTLGMEMKNTNQNMAVTAACTNILRGAMHCHRPRRSLSVKLPMPVAYIWLSSSSRRADQHHPIHVFQRVQTSSIHLRLGKVLMSCIAPVRCENSECLYLINILR